MRSKIFYWLLPIVLIVLSGCAGKNATSQDLQFSPYKFDSGQYESKVNNFQIIFDASNTMGSNMDKYFNAAKEFVLSVNESLPDDLNAKGSLRSFGHSFRQSNNPTELVYGLTNYSKTEFNSAIKKIKYAGGHSPLDLALDAATNDLTSAGGTSAIIVVSDGRQMEKAPDAAIRLKSILGKNVCIYTVLFGEDPAGKKVLEQVAQAGDCGFATRAADLTNTANLGAFIEKVFLVKKNVTPEPAPQAKVMPPPAPMAKEVITLALLFDFDSATIKEEMIPVLQQAKVVLEEDQTSRVAVSGHTCSMGSDDYNKGLSERRAFAIRKWLVDNGIAVSRLDSRGYGETQPKYNNDTAEGRKLNRRVELVSK